jgi:hypothetical protein
MRTTCAMVALLVLSACAAQPVANTACAEPRPQLCTMEFLPTCAVLADGGRKEFASPCTACADAVVAGYVNGPCAE